MQDSNTNNIEPQLQPGEVVDNKPDSNIDDLLRVFAEPDEVAEPLVDAGGAIITEPVKPGDSSDLPKPDELPAEPVVVTPTEGGEPAQPAPASIAVSQEEIDRLVNERVENRLVEEVKKYEAMNTFFDEYNKDPYAFMSKHSPHLFEKFNAIDYVQEKLNAEFGEFTPDPQKAFVLGTKDYQFRVRQDQLVNEANNLQTQAKQTINDQQNQQVVAEQTFKATKAKTLGMSESDFDTKIWSKIKAMDNSNVLDALVDAIIYKDKLAEKNLNIKTVVDLTNVVPSPTDVPAGNPGEDKQLSKLKTMFGFDKDYD